MMTLAAQATQVNAVVEALAMNVERTIEFLLKNQARMDARMNARFVRADVRFAKAERRVDRLERVVAQNNRTVTRLVRYGVSLRSDVRRIDRALAETTEHLAKTDENLAETDEKLNALIDIVDYHVRGNDKRPRQS